MKQTAVEWLVNELDLSNDTFTMKIINQAKAMEKEQIESLLEKAIQERDYYYDLWKKANAYIVKN